MKWIIEFIKLIEYFVAFLGNIDTIWFENLILVSVLLIIVTKKHWINIINYLVQKNWLKTLFKSKEILLIQLVLLITWYFH